MAKHSTSPTTEALEAVAPAGEASAPVIDLARQYVVTRVAGGGYLRMVVDRPGGGEPFALEVGGPEGPRDEDHPEPAPGEFDALVPGFVAHEIVADPKLAAQFLVRRAG